MIDRTVFLISTLYRETTAEKLLGSVSPVAFG